MRVKLRDLLGCIAITVLFAALALTRPVSQLWIVATALMTVLSVAGMVQYHRSQR
ncbi:hypothetical protein [Roseicella sp. DB1501]|uniref:hypothetical protein n=1 Tax=Roseicella sp. DB1501 TaxID=2730925 RepID=UPI0014916538|nr:hypothetical protein [Roseicella sp. DB1501]NOG70460.1 hypothetical protein [Roseicella sp. DB1501]